MKKFELNFAEKPGGRTMKTVIAARNSQDARKMLKAQYGNKTTIYGVKEIR
jgi:hypothetical protein